MALSGLAQQNAPRSGPSHASTSTGFGNGSNNAPNHGPNHGTGIGSTSSNVPVPSTQRQVIHNAPSNATPMPPAGPSAYNAQKIDGITDKDIQFLTSLAAMQIQYGRPHEAVAYLMAVRRLRPSDSQILRLLAIALMKMEAWEQANIILDEMESLSGGDGPIVYLYRSIIRFRQSDLFGAKQLFARFCALKSGGNA